MSHVRGVLFEHLRAECKWLVHICTAGLQLTSVQLLYWLYGVNKQGLHGPSRGQTPVNSVPSTIEINQSYPAGHTLFEGNIQIVFCIFELIRSAQSQ